MDAARRGGAAGHWNDTTHHGRIFCDSATDAHGAEPVFRDRVLDWILNQPGCRGVVAAATRACVSLSARQAAATKKAVDVHCARDMKQQPGPPLWLFANCNTGTFLDGHYPVKARAVHLVDRFGDYAAAHADSQIRTGGGLAQYFNWAVLSP
jgi:hypothetical protein